MKYLKMLGLAAIAAGALMAFAGAGTASATELTCTNEKSEEVMCTAPTHIHAVAEGKVVLDPPFGAIECEESTVTGRASTGSATTTVVSVNAEEKAAELESLTFGKCNATVTVLKKGSLEIHTDPADTEPPKTVDKNGTLTSTGAEVTVEFFGTHCIFATSNTHIGTVTGSTETGNKTATLDISATIPRTGGKSGAFCGKEASWTGNYSITTPDWLGFH